MPQIGIIGVGVKGKSLLSSLIHSDFYVSSIAIAEKRSVRRTELAKRYSYLTHSSEEIASNSQDLFLSIKPQDLGSLRETVGQGISPSQRVVFLVAGTRTSSIHKPVTSRVRVLRVLPNKPMSVGIGASAISLGNYTSDNVVKAVEELLKASRKTIVVDESFQDAVTVASGSGPAYYSRFVGQS